MGFTGRPSTGCALCKQRKKRCDLTRPQCQRCTTSGRKCPGVPDEIDLVFRNKFISATGSSDDTSKTCGDDYRRPLPIVATDHASSRRAPKIVASMPTNWLETATCYYFSLHYQNDVPSRRLYQWLELQSMVYAASGPDTGLNHAVHALAAMTMSDNLRIPELASIAHTAYGKALHSINSALNDPRESMKNDVAVSVYTITSFELKRQDSTRRYRYEAHIEGLKRLLMLRGRQQFADVDSLRVFRALRIQIIYDHMLRGEPLLNTDGGSIWADAIPHEVTPFDELCTIAASIPELVYQLKQTQVLSLGLQSNTLVSDAARVVLGLDKWLYQWQDYSRFEVTCVHDNMARMWNDRAHIFSDLPSAMLLNHYHLLRLKVSAILLKGLKMSHPSNNEVSLDVSDALCRMQESIDSICYSIPFITGQVHGNDEATGRGYDGHWIYPSVAEALWVLLPIVVAAQQTVNSQAQRMWLRQQLTFLNADFSLVDLIG